MSLASTELVLCGPILRRVESNSVSVWLALKWPRQVRLRIYRGATADPANLVVESPEVKTAILGANLHLLVVTATVSGPGLAPGETYGYELAFARAAADPPDDADDNATLASLGLLGGSTPIGYAAGRLPTFALPPTDIARLRIVHASCRLPHAEGPDVLSVVDDVIASSHTEPLARPHQLYLTGDQIYADDVETSLLSFASGLGRTLLGYEEQVPGVVDSTQDNPRGARTVDSYLLAPARRQELVNERAKFTTTHGASHLVTFAEFVTMYLLVWSPSLWVEAGQGVWLPGPTEIWGRWPAWLAADNEEFREHALEILREQQPRIAVLAAGLRQVRRVLANVSTFMIFDDHEVTDDWNIHRTWVEDVYGSPLGGRIVQNALSAFSVFQAWGNTPSQFAGQAPGARLLRVLEGWRGEPAKDEELQRLLGFPGNDPPAGGRLRFDYEVRCGAYDTIVLDSRTQRFFSAAAHESAGREAPGLLSPAAMQAQITDRLAARQQAGRSVEMTLLVAPAPILGHTYMERVVQPKSAKSRDLLKGVPYVFDDWEAGTQEYDREAWGFHPETFENLLHALVPFEHVVILSGDVHYGFAGKIEYWDERDPNAERRAVFVQLTASGLRNETRLTRGLARAGRRVGPLEVLPYSESYLGWARPGSHLRKGDKQVRVNGTPALERVPTKSATAYAPGGAPHWRYRATFRTDDRTTPERVDYPTGFPPLPPTPASRKVDEYFRLAGEHRRRHNHDGMRVLVGHNNFGDVTFGWLESYRVVRQTLWFQFKEYFGSSEYPVRPHTYYEILFTVPDAEAPRPDLAQH